MTRGKFHYPYQFSRAQMHLRAPLFDVEEEYHEMMALSRQMNKPKGYGCKFKNITTKLELWVNGEKAWQVAALELKRMRR